MALPQENLYTIDDIYALPDGERAELMDGQIYYMALPSRKHQKIKGWLYQEIANHISSNGGLCEVYVSPFAVFLNKDDTNYVEPDVSVICNPDKLDDKGCSGAPDWIIEVVSPSSRRIDYSIKLFKYRAAGVREYWIVDSDKNRIMIWDFENDNTEDYTFADTIAAGIYDALSIDFSSLNI